MNSSYKMNEWIKTDFQSWHDWIGNRVSVNGSKEGVLKYFGETKFANGMWCGVELDEPVGKNDGSVMGVRYFTCTDSHGIFVPLNKTVKLFGDVTFTSGCSELEILENPRVLPMPNDLAPNFDFQGISHAQEKKKIMNINSLFMYNDNVACPVRDSVLRKGSNPLNKSYLISVGDELLPEDNDILNTTVIIGEENNITFRKSPLKSDKTVNVKSSVLNATFDLDCQKGAHKLENGNKKVTVDNTFILDEQNNPLETNGNMTFEKRLSSNKGTHFVNNDEKPSFLSLSQMKDFTVCLDPSFCDNFEYGKLPRKQLCSALFSDDQTVLFDPPTDDIQNTSNQKAMTLGDSLLKTESEDGYRAFLQEMNASVIMYDKFNNDEVMEHSFQHGNLQSSTPSEQSKHDFKAKISLIPSFHFEDNIDMDTNSPNISIGYNAEQVVSNSIDNVSEENVLFDTKNNMQPNAIDKTCHLIQPNVSNLLLEINEGISVLQNESVKDIVHEASKYNDSANIKLYEKGNLTSLTKDYQSSLETQMKSVIEGNESPCTLEKSFISSVNSCFVDYVVSTVGDSNEDHVNNILNTTVVNNMEIRKFSESVPVVKIESMEDNCKPGHIEKFDVNFSLNEELKSLQMVDKTCVEPPSEKKLNAGHPTEEGNALDQTFNCNNLMSLPSNKCEMSFINMKFEMPKSDSPTNGVINSFKVPDKIISESTSNIDLKKIDNIQNEIESDLNQTFNLNCSPNKPGREKETDHVYAVEKYEKELMGHKEKDLKIVSEVKTDICVLNDTICINDKHLLPYSGENNNMEKDNSASFNEAGRDLNTTVSLSVEGDQNLTFNMHSVVDTKTITPEKDLMPKKVQCNPIGNKMASKDINKSQRPKSLAFVNPKRLTLPAFTGKNQIRAGSTPKQDVDSKAKRKPNKWDAATPKILPCTNVEKSMPKKETTTKLNTNSKMTKQPFTGKADVSKPMGYDRRSIANVRETKAMKNAYNYQRISCYAKKENMPEDNCNVKGKLTPNFGNKSFILRENSIKTNISVKSPDDGINCAHPPTSSRRNSIQSTTSQSSKQSSKIATLQKKIPAPVKIDVQNSSKTDKKSTITSKTLNFKTTNTQQRLTCTTGAEALSKQTFRKSSNQSTVEKSSEGGSSKRPGVSSRFSTTPARSLRSTASEPKKFVSKAELVKEIQTLTANCESRTKEMNFVQIHLRRATLGFEALAAITQYVTNEMDPFSQNRLVREMAKTETELKKTGSQLKFCLEQIEQIKSSHADHLDTLSKDLEASHLNEMRNLKRKHTADIEHIRVSYKDQVSWMKRKFEKKGLERKEHNELIEEEMKHECEKHMQEQRENNSNELEGMSRGFSEVQKGLKSEIQQLKLQNEFLQKQTKQTEEKFLKDRSSKVQRVAGKIMGLQQEVESLKAVLDMKSSQLNEIHDSGLEMKTKLKELRIAKEDVKNLETKAEELQRVIRDKTRSQRTLSMETHNFEVSRKKEWKVNRRLSFTNEELKWRLRQTADCNLRSNSVCDSSKPSHGGSVVRSRFRSRNSLPTLQYEGTGDDNLMTSSLPPPTLREEGETKCHPMSSSLIASLPSRRIKPLQKSSTPKRRSSSTRTVISKFSSGPPRRSSVSSDKVDGVEEFPRRNSSRESSPDFPSPKLSHDFSRCLSKKNSISWTISDVYEDFHENCMLTSTPSTRKDFEYYYAQDEQSTGSGSQLEDGVKKEKLAEDFRHRKGPKTPSNWDQDIKSSGFSKTKSPSLSTFYVKAVSTKDDESGRNIPYPGDGFVNPLFSENFHYVNKNFPLTTRKIFKLHSEEAKNGTVSVYEDSSTQNSVSSPSGSSDSMSFDAKLDDGGKEGLCHPEEFAGESMLHDVSAAQTSRSCDMKNIKTVGREIKVENNSSLLDSWQSPENAREKVSTSVSFSAPSMEMSSQCSAMTDSTNIDVSWGDDEISTEFSK